MVFVKNRIKFVKDDLCAYEWIDFVCVKYENGATWIFIWI